VGEQTSGNKIGGLTVPPSAAIQIFFFFGVDILEMNKKDYSSAVQGNNNNNNNNKKIFTSRERCC
jgi:hypothetical protein